MKTFGFFYFVRESTELTTNVDVLANVRSIVMKEENDLVDRDCVS